MIEKKKPNFFKFCIRQEIYVHIELDGKTNKSGTYICITCRSALLMAKVPSMATVNGLFLPPYNEELRLTELENNLIARNINFQYIYQLKKSRWAATKKQMITVPVATRAIQHTVDKLPRLPSDAGLIEVEFKRKMEYKNTHKKELIDPEKIIKALVSLKKEGHPYYQDFDDLESYKERCKKLDETGHKMLFGDSDRDELIEENEEVENTEEDEE